MNALRCLALVSLSTVSVAWAGEVVLVKPEQVGMSGERLARVGDFVDRLLAEKQVAGAVTVVARRGQAVWLEARGFSDIESQRPMHTDDIFTIASMTKPIATVAVMMLVEEGRLKLDDPVAKYLPEFEHSMVAVAKADAPGGYELVSAVRGITIHDLLTHRSGFPGYPIDSDRPAGRIWKDAKLPSDALLADYVKQLAALPLNGQPGVEWRYGPSTNVLGRVIEVVSGRSLDVFLRERIFEPLGMSDTGFTVPPEKLDRLVTIYTPRDGVLVKASRPNTAPRFLAANGGLFSTAPDYLLFCLMLSNGGELDGHRILKPETIELMTTPVVQQIPLPFLRGQGFGLGVALLNPDGTSGLLGSARTYGWGGAHNTYFRIDPHEQVVLAIFLALNPPNNTQITDAFQNRVMEALEK